jgi:hypothetical protein
MIMRTLLLCLLTACMVTPRANADDVIGTRVAATWRVQNLVFHHSSSVAYSCAALREKIAAILQSVGAHHRSAVSMECGGGWLRSARAHITLASPVLATSEVTLLPAGFAARAELVAGLRGASAPKAPVLERFPATWRKVSLPCKATSECGESGRGPRATIRPCTHN